MYSKACLILTLFIFLSGFGCNSTDAFKRKTGPKFAPETSSWIKNIEHSGATGMWLVTRGYHGSDHLVAVATNAYLSHAAILDLENRVVIEAIGKGVLETPLDKFLTASHRVLLVKPEGWTPKLGQEALARAKEQLGKSYDFLGTVGIPKKDRWYCTELAVWSLGGTVNKFGAHKVIRPIDMPKFGEVLFDSQNRDGKIEKVGP